jgi:hypothetical protein
MKDEEVELKAQVLSLLGWVDGKFGVAEHDVSEEILSDSVRGKELQSIMDRIEHTYPEHDRVIAAVRNADRDTALSAVRAGFQLAKTDGYLANLEVSLMMELAVAAGIEQKVVDRVRNIQELDQAFIEMEKILN